MIIKKISIIVPCYNETKTILKVIDRIKNFREMETEIIVTDDNSIDGTTEKLKNLKDESVKVVYHSQNLGKGSAIRSALKYCSGDIVIIQDADLEYNPDDYNILLKPFLEADADVVYGSRFLGGNGYSRIHYYYHYIANKLLTHFCNFFTNLNMTDMETGYKVFKTELIKSVQLKEKSFGFEPEITMKLAKRKNKFFEVPISYNGRSYEEGKKITIKDAFIAIYCIIKYKFFD